MVYPQQSTKKKHQQQELQIWSHTEQIILTIRCVLTGMKNWWHVCCVHFKSKVLIYNQLLLSYLKLSVSIFATFQFFMFWFKTDFCKMKISFLLFAFWSEMKKRISKNIFDFSNLIKALKKKKRFFFFDSILI